MLNNNKILIFLISIFFINNITALAGENPKKKSRDWEIDLGINSFYDSNILKYSDKYLERFKNREDEGRFHINRYDDLVVDYSLRITYTQQIFGKLKTKLGADLGADVYSYNNIKNWSSLDVSLQQELTGTTSFAFSYSYIPKFYIRHFYDDDWVYYYGYTSGTFQPYEFSKDDYSLWLQQYLFKKNTRVRFYFSYMRYFHNEHYTEFDSKDFLYGVRVYQRLSKYLKVNVGYKYATSDAKGIDQSGEIKELSDDSDATNYEHTYITGIEVTLPKIFSLKNDISLTAQYQEQFFTTDHFFELDPLHSGRYDHNLRVYANYNFDVSDNLAVSAFYNWLGRNTSTTADVNEEYISDEKDYSQYQLGLGIIYKIKF